MGEIQAARHEVRVPSAIKPKERFFFGSKQNIRLQRLFPPYALLSILELPLELAADVLILPFDMWYYADYLANPPLGLLVMQGKYDRLAAKLENGANPNEIDLRYEQCHYPLELAFHNHRVKAAKI